MFDWFRSWHGAPTDPKWLFIAKRAGVSPGIVSAIVWALLDHASQNEDRGEVASFDFETYAAFAGLEEEHVRAVYAALEAKDIIVAGRIAQWEKRQPKREDSSIERMRKRRTPEAQVALPLADKTDSPPDETESSAPQEPEPSAALISAEAVALADEIAVAVGHDLEFIPPAWCGASARVQTWLSAGWPAEIILPSVKAQMHRKRDGPPDRIQYFERGIARAIAEQSAPLPTIVPFPGDNTHARHAKPQSPITAAIDKLIAELDGRSGEMREGDPGLLPDRRRQ